MGYQNGMAGEGCELSATDMTGLPDMAALQALAAWQWQTSMQLGWCPMPMGYPQMPYDPHMQWPYHGRTPGNKNGRKGGAAIVAMGTSLEGDYGEGAAAADKPTSSA